MPKEQEKKLKQIAARMASSGELKRKKGQSLQDAKDAFVYGTLRKSGWKPGQEKR